MGLGCPRSSCLCHDTMGKHVQVSTLEEFNLPKESRVPLQLVCSFTSSVQHKSSRKSSETAVLSLVPTSPFCTATTAIFQAILNMLHVILHKKKML